jgi:hypothetical protein
VQKSHKHHYVPEWYQRRFMLEGQSAYYRLDLSPECIPTPSGKVIRKGEILHKGPTKFFYEIDLYTARYLNAVNDDIEKYLFGIIDTDGAKAISAMSSPNWMQEIHDHVINYYEYMDAQRLRTPKGLAWLIEVLKPKDYNDLLFSMQAIRRMHCTMWAEASMEVVSAEGSNIKFIVSDNPVTLYNSAFYPANSLCRFPFDPGIELKGTRTIFPLDLNHCAILTNLEYARSPGPYKADKPRTNPRFFDQTIINYDKIIRERSFSEQQVLAVNYILKARAHKYIAAAREDWLYPEKSLKTKNWRSLDKIFVSKSFKLLGRGGEIFIGGKDGRLLATQDEFGRKPRSRSEWLKKEKEIQEMHAHVMKLLKKEKESNN